MMRHAVRMRRIWRRMPRRVQRAASILLMIACMMFAGWALHAFTTDVISGTPGDYYGK